MIASLRLSFRMALRNLRRYARRSIITGLTLSLGFFLMVFTIGLSEGSYRNVVDTAARSGTGHVTIRPLDLDPLEPVTLDDPAAIMEAVSAIPNAHAAPRVQALVLASSAAGAHNVLALGVDPVVELTSSIFPESLSEGEWLPTEPQRIPTAILGSGLARRLDLELGDRMVLMAQVDNELESVLTRVRGLITSGSDQIDDQIVLLHAEALSELLGQPGEMHEVAVVLDDLQRSEEVRDALAIALPDVDVLTWSEALPEIGDLIRMDRQSALYMFIVLFGIVGLAVLNAVLMSVLERIKEFGVLLALGTRPSTLFTIVILEAFLLALLSVTIGGLGGWWLVQWLGQNGLDIGALMQMEEMDLAGYDMSGVIYPYLPFARTFQAVVMVISVTVLSSLYAAWKAARISPVEAISHV
jgi:ABC-type lipoprotein release transport system permease subunit